MDLSLRLRLSVMMFLQYFIWGSWGVVIFTFVSQLPTAGGLNFPGDLVGWVGSALPLGAMISPVLIGLFADRFFATEKVLVVLHLAGAGLLAWAAWTCDQNVPKIKDAFETAARAEKVGAGDLLQGLAHEAELTKQLASDQSEQARRELQDLQREIKTAVTRVNRTPQVTEAVGNSFRTLIALLIAYALCFMPTLTLTNTISFRNLSDPDRLFGGIRVLGTIGWIAGGLAVDFFLNGISTQPLYVAAAASVVLGLFCFTLPHTPPSGGARTLGDALGLPALTMLKRPSYLVFMICTFLITIVTAFYFQQGNPFLTDIKAPHPVALQTIGQASEIIFMLLIPVGLAWLGTKGMLVVGMLAWCLRFGIFATLNIPAIIAIGLPLHGICYDFFFVVAYLYVDRQAPPHLRGAAQGVITFVALGLGQFVGNQVAGQVIEMFKDGNVVLWSQVWLVPLAGAAVAALLFTLLFRGAGADQREAFEKKAD
jgi:nucleoside transporter